MVEPDPPMATIPTTTLGTPSYVVGTEEAESMAASTLRTTKRKLQDAFQSLDNAVSSHELQPPPPSKRSHTIRSLYSTLAKYGIKGKEQQQQELSRQATEVSLPTTKSTPYLSAILARAATRTRKALPFKFVSSAPPLPPTADYRPSSLPAFLARLSTFKLSTYANKPSVIDAVAASKCGWTNEGKDRLVCGLCKASWVIAGRDRMSQDAEANVLLEKQRASLVDAHKDGCPWKTRQCDPTIYCIPLQSPSVMVNDIKNNATILDPWLHNIEIKHPLTSTQITSLQSTLSTVRVPSDTRSPPSNPNTTSPDQVDDNVFLSNTKDGTSGPSDAATLTSLFGWSLAPPTPPDSTRRPSLTRANSLTPSTPRSQPQSLSRSASVRPMSPVPLVSQISPSVQQGAPATPSRVQSAQFTFRMPSNVRVKRDTILHCTLCQRRIGLWAFSPEPPTNTNESRRDSMESTNTGESISNVTSNITSKKSHTQRPFDVLKEHRAYCPYVVRSTIVPTLPVPVTSGTAASASSTSLPRSISTSAVNSQSAALEGWRAVLTVVLRYGVVQRQKLGLDFVDRLRRDATSDEPMEVDDVKAMVAGVKKRGGKDLLQYVKGLLG